MTKEQIKKDITSVWFEWHGGGEIFSFYADKMAAKYALYFEARDERIKSLEKERDTLKKRLQAQEGGVR